MNAHSFVPDKQVKRSSQAYTGLAHTQNDDKFKAEQPLLSSYSAIGVGENSEDNTRAIEMSDFVKSNGKLFFNGFVAPAERKL